MSATLFSLLAVTFGFTALVVWVYWPANRQKLESYGNIPLDVEENPGSQARSGQALSGKDSTNPGRART